MPAEEPLIKKFRFPCSQCKKETLILKKSREEAQKYFIEEGFQIKPVKLCPECVAENASTTANDEEMTQTNLEEKTKKPKKVKAIFTCNECTKTYEFETYNEGTFCSILTKEAHKAENQITTPEGILEAQGTCYTCVMTELNKPYPKADDLALNAGVETYQEKDEDEEIPATKGISPVDLSTKIISMCVAKDIVYIATETKVYKMDKGVFKPVEFVV